MPVVIETPEGGTGKAEGLVLNGLDLNSGPPPAGDYMLESIDLTPSAKKPEWAQAADADGSELVRTPLFDNRIVTAKVRVEPQASMNAALAVAGAIVDQLQEAEKNPGGIPLVWTPANSTKSITFYVLTGQVTGLPVAAAGDEAGWFVNSPVLTIRLECKPFGYGAEASAGAAVSNATGAPYLTLTVAGVPGDVSAEGRLVVTDTSAIGRRFVEWGLENRYYNPATSLFIDSEDLTPVAGGQSDVVGGYQRAGAAHHTIATKLFEEPTICCSTGNLSHIGTFRIKARINMVLGAGGLLNLTALRLNYQDGEGPFRANSWVTPIASSNFSEVDLGLITVTPAQAGSQKWSGHVEAYSKNAAGTDTLHIDYLILVPVIEGYGKARGVESSAKGTVTATDNFTTGTLSGSLNGREAPLGGKWVTSGSAKGDFSIVKEGEISRTAVSDTERRLALLGGAIEATEAVLTCNVPWQAAQVGIIVRYVNATNYAFVRATGAETRVPTGDKGFTRPLWYWKKELGIVVSGVETVLAINSSGGSTFGQPPLERLNITCSTDGTISLVVTSLIDGTVSTSASNAALRKGGALGSGSTGFYDEHASSTATTRIYNSFTVQQLPEVPYCIVPSNSLQVRSDSTIRADASGAFFGVPPQYRGSRFFVPQAGAGNRTSRILVKADRDDLESAAQNTIGDSFSAQCFYTPRYHVIPR